MRTLFQAIQKRLENQLASALYRSQFRRIHSGRNDPERVQKRILFDTLAKNKDTEFGRAHGFGGITTLQEFRARVPIRTSSEYQDWLKRVYSGEPGVLTAEAPFFFAMTAGSTGDYKYIPITRGLKRELDRSVMSYYWQMMLNFPAIRAKPIQFLVGSAEGGRTPGGVPQGFVSGFNYKNLPGFIRRKFVVPYEIFTIEDADDRYYAMARFLAQAQDLAGIGAISPMNLVNFSQAIERQSTRFVKDLAEGTLTLTNTRLSEETLSKLVPMPEVARRLEKAERVTAGEVFRELELLACWKGGNMSFYLPELFASFGKKRIFEFPLSASEGIFAIPMTPDETGGISAITGHFLEFVPEESADSPSPEARCAWELEEGKHYYLVVTTMGGLYRYNMEDLIRVKGFWHRIPIIEFISKKARQVSIANERIHENHVTVAMAEAARKTGTSPSYFLFVPCTDKRYRVLVDESDAARFDVAKFAELLDAELRLAAKGYDFEREDKLLDPLLIHIVAGGKLREFVRSQQFRTKLPNAQFKPIHLSNQFDFHQQFPEAR